MKKSSNAYMVVFVAIMVVLSVSCESLIHSEEGINDSIASVKTLAPLLDPITGGLATPLSGLLGTLAASAFAVNRLLVAKKRGDAIKEINSNPNTPLVKDQVDSDMARKVVISVVYGKNVTVEKDPADSKKA